MYVVDEHGPPLGHYFARVCGCLRTLRSQMDPLWGSISRTAAVMEPGASTGNLVFVGAYFFNLFRSFVLLSVPPFPVVGAGFLHLTTHHPSSATPALNETGGKLRTLLSVCVCLVEGGYLFPTMSIWGGGNYGHFLGAKLPPLLPSEGGNHGQFSFQGQSRTVLPDCHVHIGPSWQTLWAHFTATSILG